MSNDAVGDGDANLTHFHICIHCGYPRRREEVRAAEIRSGIFSCPDCGQDGPLNVEIRELPGA